MKPTLAIVVAFTTTPVPATLIVASDITLSWHLPLYAILGLTPVVYNVIFWFGIVVGLPLFLLGRKFHLIRWWTAISAGSATGVLASLTLGLTHLSRLKIPSESVALAFTGILGGMSGLLFWAVWRLGRQSAFQSAGTQEAAPLV